MESMITSRLDVYARDDYLCENIPDLDERGVIDCCDRVFFASKEFEAVWRHFMRVRGHISFAPPISFNVENRSYPLLAEAVPELRHPFSLRQPDPCGAMSPYGTHVEGLRPFLARLGGTMRYLALRVRFYHLVE